MGASDNVGMKDSNKSGSGKSVLEEFTNLNDTDDSGNEDEAVEEQSLDEETINKELVVWAGRLELESIDLREKAKVLTSQMTHNSETIKTTADDLKNEFKDWKQSSELSLNTAVASFSKATASFLSATKVLSTLKGKGGDTSTSKDIQKILDAINLTNNSIKEMKSRRNTNKQTDNLNNILNKKLQTVSNSLNALNQQFTDSGSSSKQNNKTLQTLNNNITKCLKEVEAIHNSQIDLQRDLRVLGTNHSNLSAEFSKFKADFMFNRQYANNAFTQLTPENSFSDTIYTLRPMSHLSPLVNSQIPQSSLETQKPRKRELKRNREPTKLRRTRSNHLITDTNLSDRLPSTMRMKQRKVLGDVTNYSTATQSTEQKTQQASQENIISLLSDDHEPTLSDL